MRNFTPLNGDIQIAIVFGFLIFRKWIEKPATSQLSSCAKAIDKTKLGIREKNEALNRLNRLRGR